MKLTGKNKGNETCVSDQADICVSEFVSHRSSRGRRSLVLPAAFGDKEGDTLDKSPANHKTKIHKHATIHIQGQLKVANLLTPQIHVYLTGRKLQDLARSPRHGENRASCREKPLASQGDLNQEPF